MSKGFQHNNPLNITPLPDNKQWIGQTGTYKAGKQISVAFDTLSNGIAAALWQINYDIVNHGYNSVYELDAHWVDNGDTKLYISNANIILTYLNPKPNGIYEKSLNGNPTQLLQLAKGMFKTENPETITDQQWQAGYNAYLVNYKPVNQNNQNSQNIVINQSDLKKYGILAIIVLTVVYLAR